MLSGFNLSHKYGTLVPFYAQKDTPIELCSDNPCSEIPLEQLNILEKTPDEILKINKTDLDNLTEKISKLNYDKKGTRFNPISDSFWIIRGDKKKFSVYDKCHCHKVSFRKLSTIRTWSCPFCAKIICDTQCFVSHIQEFHKIVNQIVIPQIGGKWCILCHKISYKRKNGTIHYESAEDLLNKIKLNWKEKDKKIEWKQKINKRCMGSYSIENTICTECSNFDKNEIKCPQHFFAHKDCKIYPIEQIIPPFLDTKNISLLYINALDIDLYYSQAHIDAYNRGHMEYHIDTYRASYAQYFKEILKRDYCEPIYDNKTTYYIYLDLMNKYLVEIWMFAILRNNKLRTPDEIKNLSLPGTILLKMVRNDIMLFDSSLDVTYLHRDLYPIIRSYMGWQLWDFEKLLTKVHKDVIRYAPSMSALLYVLGNWYNWQIPLN
ncbi:MAG: hypothetical protein Edafosvirus6_34 [Edafosvirus sp.]|uniref:Uncharacterized protein n=1 Tax=Edafosvirus sp. TaxID=2487765 RepID=A0A3G4ZTG4_9VIRU|nr:MAG: hypothetical protein Edafosvirus6_34 [Edafosvirus sp.]